MCGSIRKDVPQYFSAAVWDTKQPAVVAVQIPLPPGDFIGGHAGGINAAGDVVGTRWKKNTFNETQSAYIFHDAVSIDLNTLISDPGWNLEFAQDTNDAGQITGMGTLNGQETAFLLTPVDKWATGILTVPELVATLLGGVDRDAGGWAVVGGRPVPIDLWGPWISMQEEKRDALLALAMDEIARFVVNRDVRQEIRSMLIQVAHRRLERLAVRAGEGRVGPGSRMRAAGRRRVLQKGKPAEALKRFGLSN